MILEEKQLLVRQEKAEKEREIRMNRDKASNIKMFFKASCCLLSQLHLLVLLAEEANVAAETLTKCHL